MKENTIFMHVSLSIYIHVHVFTYDKEIDIIERKMDRQADTDRQNG